MSDEDIVLNHHAFADEGMTRDLASLPDTRVFLNFNEGADLGLVADRASIQIDELRQPDVGSKSDVGRNTLVLVHR
jgi:hypothetical protein